MSLKTLFTLAKLAEKEIFEPTRDTSLAEGAAREARAAPAEPAGRPDAKAAGGGGALRDRPGPRGAQEREGRRAGLQIRGEPADQGHKGGDPEGAPGEEGDRQHEDARPRKAGDALQ